jgi:zona occludens toxin
MLTLITGTPGAGKSLYCVWEICRKVPGAKLTAADPVTSHGVRYEKGEQVPRRLFTNIRDLIVEHQHITAEDLDQWHVWAQPGDVIVFDEVQEVWRPRGLAAKVPDCIAALETHRHKGVDIVLITQSPMLIDANVRRLVNQHFHLRRITRTVAWRYEWDHCGTPGQFKACINSGVWFHPKGAYSLYKSAQLHTKPTARLPRLAVVGVGLVASLAFAAPYAYERVSGGLTGQRKAPEAAPVPLASSATWRPPVVSEERRGAPAAALAAPSAAPAPVAGAFPLASSAAAREALPLGCIKLGPRCECFGPDGLRMAVEPQICEDGSHRVGYAIPARLAPALPAAGGMGAVAPMGTLAGVPGQSTVRTESVTPLPAPEGVASPPSGSRTPPMPATVRAAS